MYERGNGDIALRHFKFNGSLVMNENSMTILRANDATRSRIHADTLERNASMANGDDTNCFRCSRKALSLE